MTDEDKAIAARVDASISAEARPRQRWERLLTVTGGHRFFRDLTNQRIALADSSGTTPDRTDDGVLYLDHSRTIRVHRVRGADRDWCSVPLQREDGEDTNSPCSFEEALLVAETFGLAITCRNACFTVARFC